MAASGVYDVIVVGAGIEGSSTAYSLVKTGKQVLLLEQFPLPHTRGSSHGQSRISSYSTRDDVYVKMTLDSMDCWTALERECGQSLVTQCGALDLRQEGSPRCQEIANTLRANNVPYEIISPRDFRSRYPMFNVKGNVGALLNPTGVNLKADKALNAYQLIFQKLGGHLKDECPVTSVLPGDNVKVVTPKAIYTAKHVVITAGPWTGKLMSVLGLDVPITPCRATVFYWKAFENTADLYHFTKMPNFVDTSFDDNQYHCYGVPVEEYPGLVKKTPDSNPYIDKHPKYSNIFIAGGFSGYGFQLAPAIGKTLTQMVLGLNPIYPMRRFHLDRFNSKSKM